MRDVSYVNNTGIIAQNPKMTAINSCIEIDLTGQVVSDSIGTRMYSGKTSQYHLLGHCIVNMTVFCIQLLSFGKSLKAMLLEFYL
jgi:acyl-CoA hydrolase